MTDATPSVAKQNLAPVNPAIPAFAFLAMLGGNAALATGPLFVRMADVGPVAAGFWRLLLALPVLAALAYWQSRAHPGQAAGRAANNMAALRPAILLACVGGLFFAADLASWHLGILQTKLANATLFGNSASLILAMSTLLLARRLPHRLEGLAVLCAFAGAALLLGESSGQGEARLIGDLLCLLAGVLYAGYMLSMQRARGVLANWSALTVATAAGVPFLLITALALGEAVVPGDWTPVLLLALCSQLLGQGLLIYALPHFSALVVGLTLLTQPAAAALIGWLAFGERLSLVDCIGGALVAAALVLVRLPRRDAADAESRT